MAVTWQAAHELGLDIQIHCIPHYAAQIGELAAKFRETPVILDHLARPGQGTPEEYDQVLKLAKLPQVYMKYSSTGVETISKEPYPHADAKPLVKRVYEAFGADRMIWGGLGHEYDGVCTGSEVVRPDVRLCAGSRTSKDTRAYGAKIIQVLVSCWELSGGRVELQVPLLRPNEQPTWRPQAEVSVMRFIATNLSLPHKPCPLDGCPHVRGLSRTWVEYDLFPMLSPPAYTYLHEKKKEGLRPSCSDRMYAKVRDTWGTRPGGKAW